MSTMTVTDQTKNVHDDFLQTYREAIQTYGPDVAMAGLAYMTAQAVHLLEHDRRLAQFGMNAPSLATGVFTNAFHQFLAVLRETCAEGRKRGLN